MKYKIGKGIRRYTGNGLPVDKVGVGFLDVMLTIMVLGGGLAYKSDASIITQVPDEYYRFHDDDVKCA